MELTEIEEILMTETGYLIRGDLKIMALQDGSFFEGDATEAERELWSAAALILRALELCNESRSRLTRFRSTTEFWLKEARFEKEENAKDTQTVHPER